MLLFSFITVQAADQIKIVDAEEIEPGVIGFIWQADTAKSQVYVITLSNLDESTYSAYNFSSLAAYNSSFTIDDYPGYLQCYTDLVLEYGDNYSTIGELGASESVIASWKSIWDESVTDEFLLNPGLYVIFIEGVDVSFNTTEEEAYKIVKIEETSTGIKEVENPSVNNKFLTPNGKIYIIKNDNIYNILGYKLK